MQDSLRRSCCSGATVRVTPVGFEGGRNPRQKREERGGGAAEGRGKGFGTGRLKKEWRGVGEAWGRGGSGGMAMAEVESGVRL